MELSFYKDDEELLQEPDPSPGELELQAEEAEGGPGIAAHGFFFRFHDDDDSRRPVNKEDWILTEIWVGRSGRIWTRHHIQGFERPVGTELYAQGAEVVEMEVMAGTGGRLDACCFEYQLGISVLEDKAIELGIPDDEPPMRLATDSKEDYDALMNELMAFQADSEVAMERARIQREEKLQECRALEAAAAEKLAAMNRISILEAIRSGRSEEKLLEQVRQLREHQQEGLLDSEGKILKGLLEEARVDGRRPLHWAARYGYKHLCEALIEAGADPDALDDYGYPPVAEAAIQGHPDLVDKFLQKGAKFHRVLNPVMELETAFDRNRAGSYAFSRRLIGLQNMGEWSYDQQYATVGKILHDSMPVEAFLVSEAQRLFEEPSFGNVLVNPGRPKEGEPGSRPDTRGSQQSKGSHDSGDPHASYGRAMSMEGGHQHDLFASKIEMK